ncbi:MAG: hypothetical protein KME26_21415 [Oscillatoria princeps RMCB-10]|nr:hypothetical protein [Oscillatoria princeps RMCB-10]
MSILTLPDAGGCSGCPSCGWPRLWPGPVRDGPQDSTPPQVSLVRGAPQRT